jgi:hypothetical protein
MNNFHDHCLKASLLVQALDEELPEQTAWRVKLHLERCEACQARLQRLRSTTSQIGEVHYAALRRDPAAAAERQMFLARLEQEAAPRQSGSRRWLAWPRTPWHRAVWCGALSLLVVAGIMVTTSRPRPAGSVIARPVTPVVALPPPERPLVAALPAKPVRRARRIVKKHAPPAVVAAEEIATPFFALPFSDAALPLDQAEVIRVELPRSALELTGLPVDEDRRHERIRADLVLGADGLARAIRFIR